MKLQIWTGIGDNPLDNSPQSVLYLRTGRRVFLRFPLAFLLHLFLAVAVHVRLIEETMNVICMFQKAVELVLYSRLPPTPGVCIVLADSATKLGGPREDRNP